VLSLPLPHAGGLPAAILAALGVIVAGTGAALRRATPDPNQPATPRETEPAGDVPSPEAGDL